MQSLLDISVTIGYITVMGSTIPPRQPDAWFNREISMEYVWCGLFRRPDGSQFVARAQSRESARLGGMFRPEDEYLGETDQEGDLLNPEDAAPRLS